jgi:aconitate hydratase
VPVTVRRASGKSESFLATAAIETNLEVEMLGIGGVIPLILRRVTDAAAASRGTQDPTFTDAGGSTRRVASPGTGR